MTEVQAPIVVAALARAAAEPEGLRLHARRDPPGLFDGGAASKKTAQQAKEAGFLRVVRRERAGRSMDEVCAITDRGIDYLLQNAEPVTLLHAVLESTRKQEQQWDTLIESARRARERLDWLHDLLDRLQAAKPELAATTPAPAPSDEPGDQELLAALRRWQDERSLQDCPLPELYKLAGFRSVGRFHDALRRLRQEGEIYLHPWTGPLYQLTEPSLALLAGHDVAYYASLRTR